MVYSLDAAIGDVIRALELGAWNAAEESWLMALWINGKAEERREGNE